MSVKNPNGTTRWTAEMDAVLRKDYRRDTGSEIAANLHRLFGVCVTRNAVIGRAKRLNLCLPAAEAERRRKLAQGNAVRVPSVAEVKREVARKMREAKAAKRAEREAAKAQQAEAAKVPFLSLVVAEPVRFVDLPARGCRWPINLSIHEEAGPDALFCGVEAYGEGEDHRSYCRAHHHKTDTTAGAYHPTTTKRRSTNELIRSLRRFA